MASSKLNFIEELTPARDFWDIKAKIIRLWRQHYRTDFILLDERGSKIQGCVKNHLLPDFSEALQEDYVVIIRKMGVGIQNDKHRVINLDHKVNLFKCTSLTVVSDFSGHPYGFRFLNFADLLSGGFLGSLTVDVIGKVGWCGNLDIFRTNGKEHKRLNFDLEDLDGCVLRVTLWSDYAVSFNQFVASNQDNLVVVAIQHGRVKEFKGMKTVQNDMFATRIFVNGDFTESNELRKSFIGKNDMSTSTTVLSSQTVYPLQTEFVIRTPKKHVDELLEIDEPMDCVVLATIKLIEEEAGWFYNACRKCHKKALSKTEYLEQSDDIPEDFIETPVDSLWCIKCKSIATSLVPKFKIQVRVQDSTGSISFVMFDSEVYKLIGLYAVDIRERQIKSGDTESFPHELDVFKDKFLAFRVAVTKFNLLKSYHAYTVRKVCDDPYVLAELQRMENVEEVSQGEVGPLVADFGCSSNFPIDSKESVSCTDDSLAIEIVKNGSNSPANKRIAEEYEEGGTVDQGSSTRCVKNKMQV